MGVPYAYPTGICNQYMNGVGRWVSSGNIGILETFLPNTIHSKTMYDVWGDRGPPHPPTLSIIHGSLPSGPNPIYGMGTPKPP